MPGKVACTCGKEYHWRPQLAGKRARCKCGSVIEIPAEDPDAVPVATPAAPEGFEDILPAGQVAPPIRVADPDAAVGHGRLGAPQSFTPPGSLPFGSDPDAPGRTIFSRRVWVCLGTGVGLVIIGFGLFFILIMAEAQGNYFWLEIPMGRNASIAVDGKWAFLLILLMGAVVAFYMALGTILDRMRCDADTEDD